MEAPKKSLPEIREVRLQTDLASDVKAFALAAAQLARTPGKLPDCVCTGTMLMRKSAPDEQGRSAWELSMELRRIDTLPKLAYGGPIPLAEVDIPASWQLCRDTAMIPHARPLYGFRFGDKTVSVGETMRKL